MPYPTLEGNALNVHLMASPVPCLIVDRQGIILDASPGVTHLCPSVVNRPLAEVFGISQEALTEHLASQGNRALFGETVDFRRRRNPLLAQALPLAKDGAALLVITDLGPTRRAEEKRFEATPYPLMRLSNDGHVLFSNSAADRALGVEPSGLSNRTLPDLFPEAARRELTQVCRDDPRESRQLDLPAPVALRSSADVLEVRLSLMPDLGPDDRVLGRIAVISWDPWEKQRDRISEALTQGAGWASTLRNALDILREIVPHDRAVFGVLAEGGTCFRTTLVHPPPETPWPRRWIIAPPERQTRLAEGPFIDRDWARNVKNFPELADDPIVNQNLADGMRAMLVLPVGGQGRPDAVLTLAARSEEAFDGPALPLVSTLRVEAQLARLLRMADREDAAAVKRIGDNILDASSIATAAESLLVGLVEQFQWDHAALYLADQAGRRVLLFRQHPFLDASGTRNGLAVPPDYTQPLDPDCPEESGMLGATFWTGQPLVVEDTLALSREGKPPHNFRAGSTSSPQRSAMTVPVRLDGEIRWLLNIVSRTTRAFGNEDKRMVSEIVSDFEQRFALLGERLLSSELLEISEQGAVVTDRAGRILRANRRARDLLQLSGEPRGWGMLSDRGADEQAKRLLASRHTVERQPLRICGIPGGVGNAITASRHDLASDAGDSVWLFTDLRLEEWQHDSRFVESTIREVARQARGPLMLAASFVKRITDGASNADLAARAMAELDKADLTYERIAASLAARKQPVRARRLLPVNVLLSELLKTLSRQDARRIVYAPPRKILRVQGDGGRLELALRLIVASMLARIHDDRIYLTLQRRSGMAVLTLSPHDARKSAIRSQELRVEPGAPLETASIIIAAHDGRIVGADLNGGSPRMAVILPLAESNLVE
jgi:PAS domain-containing protein